ncbi:unnamed protein product [Tilletia controversa]|uniref:SET domain-containing protein n=1 Tax=Tilletia controversa TaxID=13291 RepID=A0A8X7MSP4_9BASI|nr:hypothetical protein CF328_g3627 [Tilletia controversa]KAE8247502.1 hypothetical protein A4X06_0g4407 [Tilletia controversa]CAD6918158.1 unnamed protein product [Tilletia controversa]CAD6960596.1 unnamed protein product [Tilletia controversa]CAD6967707.1 unnamed protein product [Tilletia controversa]
MSGTSEAIEVLLRRFHADQLVAVSDDVPAGRGIVLKENVVPDSIIFQVPGQDLLNVKTAATFLHAELLPTSARPSARLGSQVELDPRLTLAFCGSSAPLDEKDIRDPTHRIELELPLSSVQALTLLLTLWRRSTSTPVQSRSLPEQLSDFARSLPAEFESVPLYWSLSRGLPGIQGELANALVDSIPFDSLSRLQDVRKRFGGDLAVVYAVLASRQHLLPGWAAAPSPQELAGDGLLDAFYWAWMCVNSRCLYLPLGLKTREDNFTMAPVIDLINHVFDKTIECKVEYPSEGGMQIRAPKSNPRASNTAKMHQQNGKVEAVKEWKRGCRAGDELFITYGPHSNEFLLAEYGFILPIIETNDDTESLNLSNNPFAEVVVDDLILNKLGTDQPLVQAELKRELLRERSYWLDWTIHPTGEPSHRLVCALRLLALDLSPSKEEGSATVVALGQKGSKRLKLAKTATAPTDSENDVASIGDWEAMVSGSTELVSPENEDRARAILTDVCEAVVERSRRRREDLERTFERRLPRVRGTSAEDGVKDVEFPKWTEAYRIVRLLLSEQERIAHIVIRATKSLDEPW